VAAAAHTLILSSAKKEMNIAAKQSQLLNQSTPAKKITPGV
jgi:hypothetical protein